MTATQLQFPEPARGVINPTAGEAAKERGMALAEAATDVSWADACDRAIQVMAARGEPFQASDLIREGLVDEPADHHQWGPRLGNAAKKGWIEEVGTGKSKRVKSRRSRLATWIGADAREVAA